jgi:hypothetical protein
MCTALRCRRHEKIPLCDRYLKIPNASQIPGRNRRGSASAGVRGCKVLCGNRCCQLNRSDWPSRRRPGHRSKNARVSRVSQALRCLGQRLPWYVHYECVTESRPHWLLRRASVRPNSSAEYGRTLLRAKQSRRESATGRLRCAL